MNWHRAYLGDPDWKWNFPEAFQPQLDFKTEWWWYGGHLYDGDRRFSYHAVLFRFGKPPPDDWQRGPGVESTWIAQWAITDHKTGEYHTGETVLPESFQFPKEPTAMFIGDAKSGLGLRFTFGNPVLQGERGVTQKGPNTGDASYHFACPSSNAEGKLRIGEEVFKVKGSCWFDREIGSDMFGGKPGSWQWLSGMLKNGKRISRYELNSAWDARDIEEGGEFYRFEPMHEKMFESKLTAPYAEWPCRIWRGGQIVGYGFKETAGDVLI